MCLCGVCKEEEIEHKWVQGKWRSCGLKSSRSLPVSGVANPNDQRSQTGNLKKEGEHMGDEKGQLALTLSGGEQ